MISVDGTSGAVYLGEVPVIASNVVQYFEGELEPDADALVAAVHTLMTHADGGPAARRPRQRRQRPRLRAGPPRSAPAASAWSGPSTCSWASAASWSRT